MSDGLLAMVHSPE